MKRLYCITFIFSILSLSLYAQLNITSLDENYMINFDTPVSGINPAAFNGTGFSPVPTDGQLNSNGIIINGSSDEKEMTFGETYSTENTDFTRGLKTGGIRAGGIYAFEVEEENIALGLQPTESDFTKGEIILKIKNNTSSNITNLKLSYDIFSFNDQDKSSSFNFSYSTDNLIYIEEPTIDFNTQEAGDENPEWIKENKTINLMISIPADELIFLKWITNDVSGSGSRDEIAIDNISCIAKGEPNNNTPTSMNEIESHQINAFPNPTKSKCTIEADKQIKAISLVNSCGIEVFKQKINNTSTQIDISNTPIGFYTLFIEFEDGSQTTKKIIKK